MAKNMLIKKPKLQYQLIGFCICVALTQSAYGQIFGNKVTTESAKSIEAIQVTILDLQRQLETVKLEKSQLQGQIELLQKQVDDLSLAYKGYYKDIDTRMAKIEPQSVDVEGLVGDVQPGEKQVYENALKSFQSGQLEKADGEFSAFIQKYTASPYLPLALYWSGNTKYALKNYGGAIGQYEVFLAKYPNHRRTPSVIFGLANSQLENGNKLIANLLFTELMGKFPTSPEALQAKTVLAVEGAQVASPVNKLPMTATDALTGNPQVVRSSD